MKNMSLYFNKKILILICLLLAVAYNGFSQTDKDKLANEILKTIDTNLMPQSYEAYRKIIDIEPDGKQKEYTLYTVKKGLDKVAMLFLAPASDKDRSLLRVGDNVWLYIPSVGRPIRQTTLQSATGGIFNNSDVMMLDYSQEYNATIIEQKESGYIIKLKAKNRTVAYDTLKMWVNKKSLLPVKIECYSASNMLLKTLEFKNLKNFGTGLVRPSVIETHSPLYEGYRSIMIFAQIKERVLDDEVFTLNYMSKLGDLR